MRAPTPGWIVLALTALLAWAVPAAAQSAPADPPPQEPAPPRLSAGGELGVIAGPSDHEAYFNYTDYDRNGLRILRLRVFGEWHASSRVSLVGELRTEDIDHLAASALYLRWQPSMAHAFYLQAGRIPPVVGAFSRRAYGHDNAVMGAPLAYQYLTSLRPDALPATTSDLLRMRGRGWETSYPLGDHTPTTGVSLLSVSRWDTGVESFWQHGPVELSGAITRGAPAVPVVRETNGGLMWSGRAATRIRSVIVGVSGARGEWLDDDVLDLLPEGRKTPAGQRVVAADAEWGSGPWLLRSEWVPSTFDVPLIGSASPETRLGATSAFVEGRYRPRPRWELGMRLDRLSFSSVVGSTGTQTWDAPVTRLEGTLGFRVTRQFELRGGWQQNWRDGGRVTRRGFPAVGATIWF
jgi:hypothetical protein